VRHDYERGLLTKDQARSRYGVVFEASGDNVHHQATVTERARQESARVNLKVRAVSEDEFNGSRRVIRLDEHVAERLCVAPGALVEVTAGPGTTALRGWFAPSADRADLSLGPAAFSALRLRAGSVVEISAVQVSTI
jgi:hypothetical protein